jgi:TorA maturation chaperone TorD
LGVGYDNLFVVPGSHYVPPFASAHATDPSEAFESDSRYHTAGEAGELLGDPAADMAQLYAAAGFSPERGDEIPDHIAACFEFMRALCEREAALLDGEGAESDLRAVRELQSRTLSSLGWIDRFEAAVASSDTVEGVFAAIARLARTFTAWDAREVVQAEPQPSETTPS